MKIANAPAKFPVVWASGAGAGYVRTIPVPSQIGVTPGAASFTDGFPPLNFLDPVGAGGVPPFGADFNGVLKAVTAGMQGINAGMLPSYDAAFSSSIGGYPNGAALISADGTHFWRSTVDDNTSNPDAGGANWTVLQPGSYAWSNLTGVPSLVLLSSVTGSNQLLAANGYQKMAGGLILQWGTYTASTTDTGYTIALPTSFPNNHFAAFACPNWSGNVAGCWSAYATPAGLSQVTLTSDVNSGSFSNIPLTFWSIGN